MRAVTTVGAAETLRWYGAMVVAVAVSLIVLYVIFKNSLGFEFLLV